MSYTDLHSSLLSLLPCEQCVTIDKLSIWYGEEEYFSAWPIARKALTDLGLHPSAVITWRVSSTKQYFSIFVLLRDGTLTQCYLSNSNGDWVFEKNEFVLQNCKTIY